MLKLYEAYMGVTYWLVALSEADAAIKLVTFWRCVELVDEDELAEWVNDLVLTEVGYERADSITLAGEDPCTMGQMLIELQAKHGDFILPEDAVFACSEWP